jgi:hypothetical protein
MAPGDPLRALVERSLREPGITRVVGRGASASIGRSFHPGERSRHRRPRVLVLDGQPATGVDGVDVWRPGVVPLDAMPAVLRSCDALLDADDAAPGWPRWRCRPAAGR